MKPDLKLNLGKETSGEETESILSAFSPYFQVTYEKNIIRLSADWLPLIIEFTIVTVASGVFYDAFKGALIALQKKIKTKELDRNPAVIIRIKDETYVATEKKISLRSIDVELNFNSVDEFIEHVRSKSNGISNKTN